MAKDKKTLEELFEESFAESKAKAAVRYPHVTLDGFTFRLVGIDAYHEWITTGEVKADGTPKWAQSPDYVYNDTGDAVRCVLDFQLVDASGTQTSAAAPFRDSTHYLTYETVQALTGKVGETVTLTNPRIEFRDTAVEVRGFRRVETEMRFAFDDVGA